MHSQAADGLAASRLHVHQTVNTGMQNQSPSATRTCTDRFAPAGLQIPTQTQPFRDGDDGETGLEHGPVPSAPIFKSKRGRCGRGTSTLGKVTHSQMGPSEHSIWPRPWVLGHLWVGGGPAQTTWVNGAGPQTAPAAQRGSNSQQGDLPAPACLPTRPAGQGPPALHRGLGMGLMQSRA